MEEEEGETGDAQEDKQADPNMVDGVNKGFLEKGLLAISLLAKLAGRLGLSDQVCTVPCCCAHPS